mgnify:CR=1 FL=1
MPENQLHLVFFLIGLFQIKHYLADFPLQQEYMVKSKVKESWSFVVPLATHCFVHALITLSIILWVVPSLWWLSLVDFALHFMMDRIKSGPKYLGRFNDQKSSAYWNCFGFDQMVHHFTHYGIVYLLVTNV